MTNRDEEEGGIPMTKRYLCCAVALAFLAGAARPAVSQEATTESTTEKKVKSDSGTTKTSSHTVIGTVTELEAGKSLKVKTAAKKTRSFTLDDNHVTTTVDPSIAVGSKVKVVEKTDAAGTKSLTVEPYVKSTKAAKKSS
jgi:hypothetical protein